MVRSRAVWRSTVHEKKQGWYKPCPNGMLLMFTTLLYIMIYNMTRAFSRALQV